MWQIVLLREDYDKEIRPARWKIHGMKQGSEERLKRQLDIPKWREFVDRCFYGIEKLAAYELITEKKVAKPRGRPPKNVALN